MPVLYVEYKGEVLPVLFAAPAVKGGNAAHVMLAPTAGKAPVWAPLTQVKVVATFIPGTQREFDARVRRGGAA